MQSADHTAPPEPAPATASDGAHALRLQRCSARLTQAWARFELALLLGDQAQIRMARIEIDCAAAEIDVLRPGPAPTAGITP